MQLIASSFSFNSDPSLVLRLFSPQVSSLTRSGPAAATAGSSTADDFSLPLTSMGPLASTASWAKIGILAVNLTGPTTLKAGTQLNFSFTLVNPLTPQTQRSVTVAVLGVPGFPVTPAVMATDTTTVLALPGSVAGDAAVMMVRSPPDWRHPAAALCSVKRLTTTALPSPTPLSCHRLLVANRSCCPMRPRCGVGWVRRAEKAGDKTATLRHGSERGSVGKGA